LLWVLVSGLSVIVSISHLSNILVGLLAGAVAIAIGLLSVRMVCEAWIVFFKMHEALEEIRKK
jgi:hypothetical protein